MTLEYKEAIRKMRVERLDYQREFLKLATSLNRSINEEIALGEEKKDMQVCYVHLDRRYSEGFQCAYE